ncbi:TIGR03620 family F420-dependent LLM class oxidoreductase [Actinosynnema sp. NPDC047251]|uniref:Putative F420-dependent oxidoreductase n=1 Tax=Saccharothrix espanaensis (strain ATCC 51144 / DSM 44229 / JCM 9112 / NBRC 15066 / NRRL 15764) TaxID=1179773 RepID=K0JXK2_SACES|nr:TIGR03620 family F420-dependent LLM class oxidoreductase [Saccharothrix espanaensis]CCH32595.1 putative F420-dependent oxidoreductase [Saccharothrix espanaensis DSM 44229]
MSLDLGLLGAHLREHEADPRAAAELERAGYGTLWLDASPPADLVFVEQLLDATTRLVVGTSVVNVWTADAETVAASYHRIEARHPGRFLLGVGVGHREVHTEYTSPYAKLVSYLDQLAQAGVPAGRTVVAALGPKMLRLARDRTAGAVPCMVPPEHTRRARSILGVGKLLLPGHFALVEPDLGRARAIARSAPPGTALGVTNYAANLQRLDFTEDDLSHAGSDRLIDALVAHGDPATVATRLLAHRDAGADHVGVYPLGDDLIATLRTVAEAVHTAKAG